MQAELTWVSNSKFLWQEVQYKLAIASVWETVSSVDNTVQSYTIEGLDDNAAYDFRVVGVCENKCPTPISTTRVSTITAPTPIVSNEQVNSFDYVFTPVGGDVNKYILRLFQSDGITLVDSVTFYNPIGDVSGSFTEIPSANYKIQLEAIIDWANVSAKSPLVDAILQAPVQNLIWIPDQIVCEREGGYGIVKSITGLSSPEVVWYDAQNNLVYVADGDEYTKGNVYWFNPDTATSPADMIYSSKIKDSSLYAAAIDTTHRRIYFVGANTHGLLVYDIDTDTTSVVNFGLDQNFNRTTLLVTPTRIYTNDKSNNSIVIIDRETLTLLSNVVISTIPNNTRFIIGGYQMTEANGELWIYAGSGSSIGTVGVYNLDLTANIANVNLNGATIWDFSRFWQNAYSDKTTNRFYVSDYGSSKRFVIDCATKTVIDERVIGNKNGKATVNITWTTNPITGQLYAIHYYTNSYNDASVSTRAYIEDRDTFQYTAMFVGQAYTQLSVITGTNNVVGCVRGAAFWEGISGWNTDGSVTILSNSAVLSGNTGNAIVVTLKQVDANNVNTPTGLTKDNVIGDPDYEEPYKDDDNCAITTNLNCPTNKVKTYSSSKLEWEFTLDNSVINNAAIKKIQVFAFNVTTNSVQGTPVEWLSPFTSNYFSGSINGLSAGFFNAQIKYLDNTSAVLQTCNIS